jgi:hypothetical protein
MSMVSLLGYLARTGTIRRCCWPSHPLPHRHRWLEAQYRDYVERIISELTPGAGRIRLGFNQRHSQFKTRSPPIREKANEA